jgi:hypothetical protein
MIRRRYYLVASIAGALCSVLSGCGDDVAGSESKEEPPTAGISYLSCDPLGVAQLTQTVGLSKSHASSLVDLGKFYLSDSHRYVLLARFSDGPTAVWLSDQLGTSARPLALNKEATIRSTATMATAKEKQAAIGTAELDSFLPCVE